MNKQAKAAAKRTGKKYGGKISNCKFIPFKLDKPFEGLTEGHIATGDLSNDPGNRFGVFGNFGMRTSYIVERTPHYIETRNTIYEYEE